MWLRVREGLAVLLAPVVFFLYMVWSRPAGSYLTPAFALVAYVFASCVFWPPALGAEFLGRKFQISMPKVVALSFALSGCFGAIGVAITVILHPDPAYKWPSWIRDILDCATTNMLGFILYRLLSAREPRIDLLRRT
jgi:hypothetical protein